MGMDLRGNAAKGYDDQANANKVKVRSGYVEVVGIGIQRRTNAKGTKSLRYKMHVLGALDAANREAIGTAFSADLWWDLTKKYNADRVSWLLMANGASPDMLADFDPDSDTVLVNGITGTPFIAKLEVTERKGTNGRAYTDVQLIETKDLPREKRQAHMDAPDWHKIVPPKDKRVEEPFVAEATAGGGKGGDGGGSSTYNTDTSDLPF